MAEGLGAAELIDPALVNETLAPFGKLFLRPGDIRLEKEKLRDLTRMCSPTWWRKRRTPSTTPGERAGAPAHGHTSDAELERVVMLRVVASTGWTILTR